MVPMPQHGPMVVVDFDYGVVVWSRDHLGPWTLLLAATTHRLTAVRHPPASRDGADSRE